MTTLAKTEGTVNPLSKHHGPGPHPGTGTPQSVHGSRTGGGVAIKDRPVDPKRVPGEGGKPGIQEKLVDVPRADMGTLLGFTREGDEYYGDPVNAMGESFYDLQLMTKDDWVQWQGARDIRQAAAEIAGVDESETFETVDPHVDMNARIHQSGFMTETVNPKLSAQYLMESLIDGEEFPDLYRAIGMLDSDEMNEFLGLAIPGTVFDAPLLSFSNHAVIGENNILERFGTDILLHIDTPATGLYTGAMQEPMWTQRDEDSWLRDMEITMLGGIDESEEPDFYASMSELQDAIGDHIAERSPMNQSERYEVTEFYGDEGNSKWAGSTIDSDRFADIYYEVFDEAEYGTDPGLPGEIISGGRFRVVSAEPGSGDFDAWDHVITIEQIGVFDPFNPKTLIEKMVKAAFVLDGGPLTNPEVAARVRERRKIRKHHGPGLHPGTMSPQSVHGGASGGTATKPSAIVVDRVSKLNAWVENRTGLDAEKVLAIHHDLMLDQNLYGHDAAWFYGGHGEDINTWYRGGDIPHGVDKNGNDLSDEAVVAFDQELIILTEEPLTKDLKLFRGFNAEDIGLNVDNVDEYVGRNVGDYGFMSTSLDPDIAVGFALADASEWPSVIMEIDAPEGTLGAYIEGKTNHDDEYEVLLTPATSVTITGITVLKKVGYLSTPIFYVNAEVAA